MRTAAFVLAAALALPLPARAESRTVTHNKIVGNSAFAQWEYTQGDVATGVFLIVTNNNVTGSTPSEDKFLTIAIDSANIVTGNPIVSGVLPTSNFTLTVDHDLGTATLTASGVFEDLFTLTSFPMNVNLTFTATSELTKQHSHFKTRDAGFMFHSHFKGDFRDATATGSIFGNNTEFVNGPASVGQIQANQFGELTISFDP
jgi:hypothetical protein